MSTAFWAFTISVAVWATDNTTVQGRMAQALSTAAYATRLARLVREQYDVLLSGVASRQPAAVERLDHDDADASPAFRRGGQ
jgi:hypothetical protein